MPWKCPDCGVWWSGLEHRCAPTVPGNSTNVPPPCPPWYPPNWSWPPFETNPYPLHDVRVW